MFNCTASSKWNQAVVRYKVSVQLEPALVELFNLYDRTGGPGAEVVSLIDRAIENCLGDVRPSRENAQQHLHRLLRTRDLHQFVTSEADLVPIKLKLMEHLLLHRNAQESWAAIRGMLAEQIDGICRTPLPGLYSNFELYKQHVTDRASRLGRMLVLTALFNFDRDEETPPANLIIRFRKGRFPEHSWEIVLGKGRIAHHGAESAWSPANPLCRWEYLGADLMHALFRRSTDAQSDDGRRMATAAAYGDFSSMSAGRPDAGQGGSAGGQLYCRFEAGREAEQPQQLDLFPVDPDGFVAEIQRRVHRRYGAEGIRLLALLLAHCAGGSPGAVIEVHLAGLAARTGLQQLSLRSQRSRVRKLEGVIQLLADIELTRVTQAEGRHTAHTSRLLTVLGRAGGWAAAEDGSPEAAGDDRDPLQQTVRLVLDQAFHRENGTTLGTPYAELPERLLDLPVSEHPFALPLYAYLRRSWVGRGETGGPLERSARRLLHEAGLWVSDTGRYRALETLKRDLERLRECGYLGSWRLKRSPARDALEDLYRLEAPRPESALRTSPMAFSGTA